MGPPLPVPMHHSMAAAVYDPAADRWEVLPQVPTQRNHLAVVGIGSKVYVAGGRFGGGTGTVIHQVYRPTLSCA